MLEMDIGPRTDSFSGTVQHFQEERANGIGIFTTAVFIVGEIAGSGVLALPSAVKGAGWTGLALIVLCCFLSAYTGDVLGRAWTIVRERNEIYRSGHVRYPYPAIGEVAYGKFGRYLVSFSINFTLFGVGVVFLLIASENIASLINSYHHSHISFCYISIAVAGALIPFTWFGTPADFWFVAVGATAATGTACVILLANIIKDESSHTFLVEPVDFTSFFMAFGTICFAFGGHPAFPTFQADMRNQKNFGKAVLLGYLIVLLMYFPVSTAGYYVYGKGVGSNVLGSVSHGPMKTIVTILITLHLLFGFIIVINPFSQEVEHVLKIDEHFTWKRAVSRTCMVIAVLFVAQTIPHFGAILSLVGGSTTTLLAYICPSLFYLKLCRMRPEPGDSWDPIDVPLHVKVLNYEIVTVGIIAGVASSYSAIEDLISSQFTVPCYVNPVLVANKTG